MLVVRFRLEDHFFSSKGLTGRLIKIAQILFASRLVLTLVNCSQSLLLSGLSGRLNDETLSSLYLSVDVCFLFFFTECPNH